MNVSTRFAPFGPWWLCLSLVLGACGGARTAEPPQAGDTRGMIPDLRGTRVMVYPVQSLAGVGSAIDRELEFTLRQRGAEVDWVMPGDLAAALEASPGFDTRIRGLPVWHFMQVEVRRVGDPLYGFLRRAAALANSSMALLPIVARPAIDEEGGFAGVEIAAALIAVNSGRVVWFGIVGGDPGPPDDPRALASAADELGRRILPLSGRSR